ncbi:SDR family oxidoreductase [Asanoa sp. WMMD1127]|uniref:SDR family NAD(P)-dependent oxidoreductase n=1 Tax=Asanoa sp. WMMD1127 TaxID=3016107 RepID=UPI00241752D1|nr:SDR family oxidoreductase [Asanoa sp. WMMD1127]MDG4822306.1 SDR family oxidoreductase [Asanoa sp. WMMD1127]
MPTALVTGASSGIGAAFARRLAADGYRLVLVSRDADRLTALAADVGGPAEVLPADLATEAGVAVVAERLAGEVDLLVNNAGSTLNRSFLKTAATDETALLRLNIEAVMRLTHAALPAMTSRGSGAVINVSSVSAFAPVMPGSTYPASKAWVTHFSESIGQAVGRHGVRVMALCPGYTRTEFHDRAGIDMSKTPSWLWLQADEVVAHALRDLARGRLVSVPNWKYRVAVFGMRHAPRAVFTRVANDTRGRLGRDTL